MKTIDLTTLQGWNDLPNGTYSVTVGAKAAGYTRIIQSEAVSIVKESPQEEYFLTFKSKNGTQFNTYMNVYGFDEETGEEIIEPGISWDGTVEYSTDKESWNVWDGTSVSSSVNGEIYFRGTSNTYFTDLINYILGSFTFDITNDTISIEGNIENLLDYQEVELGNHPTMATHCFAYLFTGAISGRSDIEDASKLVLNSTTLTEGCYENMFNQCTKLTTAPALPATTLASSCYSNMFRDCTSLYVSDTLTPEAPYEWRIPSNAVISGTTYSQNNMFSNCLGTRLSDNLAGQSGQQYVYYTQNPPVGSN